MTTARRDEFGYLFVVTYGRSGSTLLMGLLNSIPGYLVRGENWDALHHLFRFHRTLAEGSQRWDPARLRQRTHPFFGAGDFPVQQVARGHPPAGARHRAPAQGRHPRHRVQGDPLVRRRRRGVRRVAARGVPGRPFRREHPRPRGGPAQRLVGQAARERRAAPRDRGADPGPGRGLGDAAYRVHYNDYVADPSVLRGLFDWLGEPFDEAAVRSVLETPPLGRGGG